MPLEVRHLTVSTGSLTLPLSSTGWHEGAVAACAGIAVIGLFNFGVSLVLALAVALRAREVERGGWRVSVAVLRRFVHAPLGFFFPNEG